MGQLPTSSGGRYTCDTRYFDGGRACAWHNFLCEEYSSNGIVPLSFPTCFDGSQQSPINLDVSEATVGDPGQITFSGFGDQLSQTPVVRLKSFTLQLDFKQTLTLPAASSDSSNRVKVTEEEPLEEILEEDNEEEGDEEELEPGSLPLPFNCTDCANCTECPFECRFCQENERPFIEEQDCFNCGDCPFGSESARCLKCQFCPGREGPDCRTCLEKSLDLPGCQRCRSCPQSPSDSEEQVLEENGIEGEIGDFYLYTEDVPDCRTCFDLSFDHPDCGQCQSCPGGPLDAAGSEKITKNRKNKKRKNKRSRKNKKERKIREREGRQTAEEGQLPTISGGALGANT